MCSLISRQYGSSDSSIEFSLLPEKKVAVPDFQCLSQAFLMLYKNSFHSKIFLLKWKIFVEISSVDNRILSESDRSNFCAKILFSPFCPKKFTKKAFLNKIKEKASETSLSSDTKQTFNSKTKKKNKNVFFRVLTKQHRQLF